jgi:DNA polymerase
MITFDFETKSYADLMKVGAWVYSLHATTEVICCAYGIGDEKIQTWWPGKELEGVQAWETDSPSREMPCDLYMALMKGEPIEAHNVGFEKAIWQNICMIEYNWLEVLPHQWRDTQAVAAYYSMPPALGKLSRALGFQGKNPEGVRLISKYSKLHLKTAVDDIPQEDFDKFVEYCVDDVIEEQAVSDELGDLPPEELEIFLLDQEINERGIYLDEKTIRDAIAIVDQRSKELADEFRSIVGLNPTQNAKVKEWLHDRDVPMENLQADYIEEVLEGEHNFMPEGDTLKALRIITKYNKASTKKLDAMLRQRGPDGRARFQSKYHGAMSGRWTGTGFQPLNLSRGFEDVPPERLIADLSHRSPEWLDVMYGDAMEAVGKASRHHIRAEEGSRIIAGDFVSIEAVLLACQAHEEWKVKAFKRGDPLYELMGCKIHNLDDDAVALAKSDKKEFKNLFPQERFDGKTGELAFGYQGALGAWLKFDNSGTHSDDKIVSYCKSWRGEHPATVQYWYDMERGAIRAVEDPGSIHEVNTVAFQMFDEWLAMWLPNDKRIWYREPELGMAMPQWHKPLEWEDCADGTCDCKPRRQLTYLAQKTGRWQRVSTYGGKLVENATQATSREVLIPAMLRLRDAGYKIILSVYDEIVTEMPYGQGSVEELTEIMSESPGDWAKGWPITVEAWEGERYRK